MDRLSQLRGEAGGSGDSTLDTTSPPSDAFMSANENSSKYFSINDSTFDITPIKDVSLASTSADADRTLSEGDELISSHLSPIGKKELDNFKIGKQIEAANILSGGVDIFDGNDNSFDGHELVIDDNIETEDKADNPGEVEAPVEVEVEAPLEEVPEPEPAVVEPEANATNREMEVVLQIDGNNVNAIDIGNGLYLYRKDGQDELAAIQIIDDDPQHSFKFLKVRDNAEGNLEVYEEIEIEVPKEVPTKEGKLLAKSTPRVPTVDINKSMGESSTAISKIEGKNKSSQNEPIASTSTSEKIIDDKEISPESKAEVSWNGKMKFCESRKSPVVGSFTPMTFHSTPNKEGKPLTKTMVDLQLDPNRHSDNVKKTIEVHTENVKQKTTELHVKDKDVVDNVKSVHIIPAEKELAEKSNEVASKQQLEQNTLKKDNVQNQNETVKADESENTHKSEIDTNKEKSTPVTELVIEDQNNISVPSNNSKESTEREISSPKTEVSVLEKEVTNNTSKDSKIVLPNPDKPVLAASTVVEEKNRDVVTSVTKEVPETANKPVLSAIAIGPVDSDINKKDALSENKVAEKDTSSVIKNDLAASTVKDAIPVVVEKIENISSNSKKDIVIKPSKIKILENISIKFPSISASTEKSSALQVQSHQSESSINPADNIIKFPLESFSEVSSTCTNLGSDESKEERITLYSFDTDESVSLITPSSTTKIRDDKTVVKDNISDVLTTISSLRNIQNINPPVSNDKPVSPVVKKSTVSAKAKSEADSTSIIEQASCSNFEKPKSSDTTNLKDAKEVREHHTPILGTKLPDKPTSSVPVSKLKDSDKSTPCLVAKENLAVRGHPSTIDLKSPVKETQHSPVSEIKSTDKASVSETKPNMPQAIPVGHVNTLDKSAKSTVSQDMKPVPLAIKIESKSAEKVVISGVPVANTVDKKYPVLSSAKVINITSIPAKTKQPEISSTSSNKLLKTDSHIPVMSVANKPSSKLMPLIAPKVETAPIKSPNNTSGQKEPVKSNVVDKKPIAAKNEAREITKTHKSNVAPKPVNNNHTVAVPFGKWTDAHRQEFVNKFKEVKVPLNTNSKQIKNSNDLNRRDVLQKIDSQRAQTMSNATSKAQEKLSVKSETVFSSKVVSPTVETKTLPCSEPTDDKLKQVCSKVIPKQENTLKPAALSSLSANYAKDVNPKMLGKTKPLTAQTTSKKESVSMEQSTISKTEQNVKDKRESDLRGQSAGGKTEPTLKEQSTVAKTENAPRDQNTASCYMASLIDKTIEDMINKVAPEKSADELKQANVINPNEHDSQKPVSEQISKPIIDDSVSLDDIEMKMNELHGIPFVERPPHELPKILKSDIKTYSKIDKTKHFSKVTKITNTTCEPILIKDLDSDEEIIEHEPITGDLDLKKKSIPIKIPEEKKQVSEKNKGTINKHAPNKDSEIITETEFDKFARRNSITYENCLTVNFDRKEPQNVQMIKGKDVASKVNPKLESTRYDMKSKLPVQMQPHFQADKNQGGGVNSSVPGDSSSKKYQSKIHNAYQSALTAKHQVSRPIGIIEDKPVKVVFLESNIGFVPSQLNVQGHELSPAKKPDTDTSNNDSIDSGMSDQMFENKQQDKTKIKHQRKQVLTPVEEPDLELIQPSDIGIEITSKKKRKVEDIQAKNLVPKKSYLLGRNTTTEDKIPNTQVSDKDNTKHIITRHDDVPEHKDAASAIDNLVKAAELLDNQAGDINKSVTPDLSAQVNTPVKRGRGRPRKYPLPDGIVDSKSPSPQKKPRLIDAKPIKQDSISDEQDDDSSDEAIVRENWTMGKINENIVCPICNKLFRSENVVFKHVKHCTGVSPNRSESDKRSPQRSRLSQESEDMDYDLSSSESKKDSPKKRKSKESAKSEATPDQTKLDIGKDEVIIIEDTPIKEKSEKSDKDKEEEPKKEIKAKGLHQNKNLTCEFCGKTFRQQSYLLSHKLQHKKDLIKKKDQQIEDSKKLQVFSCEVCKKEFRKLHHLVQHRINHNPDSGPRRALRKSSEQNELKNLKEDAVVKQVDDASAGFRCEPCDKSFRKLHHLVEHRGTHDGINRQKPSAPAPPTVEKPPPPPQCEICKKTFRKLHHLIEHKEQHAETSSDKSDDKSGKSALSTKDIIHECSLCYMVFPNEHSLNKHSANCSKKKRQSKQIKDTSEIDAGKEDQNINKEKKEDVIDEDKNEFKIVIDDQVAKEQHIEEMEKLPQVDNVVNVEKPVVIEEKQIEKEKITLIEVVNKPSSKEEAESTELLSTPVERDMTKADTNKLKEQPVVPEKIKKTGVKEIKTQDIPKKKTVPKAKGTPHVTKRQKSIDAVLPAPEVTKPSVESSDDDEVRYMLNPDFKVDDTSEGKTFMKVRARKRNSLQIERPTSNDHAKRRTSLQLPPKVSRLKPKTAETKSKADTKPKAQESNSKSAETKSKADTNPKAQESNSKSAETKSKADTKPKAQESNSKSMETKSKPTENKASAPPKSIKQVSKSSDAEAVLSTDSDDSDVKYSFPKTVPETSKPVSERTLKNTEKKTPRKSLVEKRKSLGGIAKRKSLGKAITAKHKANAHPQPKPIKRRTLGVELRCDCGELFSSAALLARHATLAHTPPRIRRARSPPAPRPAPPAPRPAPAQQDKQKPTRKSTSKTEAPPPAKPAPTRKSSLKKTEPETRQPLKPEPNQAPKTRRAHSGVPVPEKKRKMMNSLK